MSNSKSRSEIIASDEEDYKSNIPYNLNNTAITAAQNVFEAIEKEEKHTNASFNCEMWHNDNGFMEDNSSVLDVVDYQPHSVTGSSLPTSAMGTLTEAVDELCHSNRSVSLLNPLKTEFDNSNYFTLNNATNATTSAIINDPPIKDTRHFYNENVEEDIKFSPTELIPPSPSTLQQYDYNISLASSHMRTLPPTQHAINSHNFVCTHPHPQQTFGPTQYDQYPHSSGYNQNMWYQNAPHGTASGYCRTYGGERYYNYGTYPHDPMIDMLQLSNSGREARNRAEKNRRDKLNGCIQELSTMVPHVANSQRRVDKTTILRCATHGLRLVYTFGKSHNQSRPQYTDSLMELLDRFFIVITCHGEIVLVSSSVEQHLGHCQIDLYGQNILNITHPEDHNIMKQQLIPTDLDELFNAQCDGDPNERKRTKEEEEHIDKRLRADKRSFTVRLARAGPRSEPTSYEIVKIEGNFRRSDAAPRDKRVNTFPSTLQIIRRSRGRDDTIPLHTISGNDIVLIATTRIIRLPKVINSVFEANTMKYKTRHLIDGRIIDCDQGIGLVAGYMTDEVQNLSPFTFMHQDDVRWVIVALRQMYDCKSSFGESTYRLITRNGHFIYLHSKGYLEVDKETQEVRSFICVNTLLDEEEGKRRVQEMKNKFSLIVNTKIPQSSIDEPASNNPQQLEKAVLCLIQNLQKSPVVEYDDDGDSSTGSYACEYVSPTSDPSTPAASIHRSNVVPQPTIDSSIRAAAFHFARSVKTPPLALVPPEPSSVKTSISKSVSVVNVTAAKYLRNNQQDKTNPFDCETNIHCGPRNESNIAVTASSNCAWHDINDKLYSNCQTSESHDTTEHTRGVPATSAGNKRCCEVISTQDSKMPPKRRLRSSEIEHVLTSSLDQLGKTLDQQLNAAIELRDKTNKYEMPNSNQRIDEIMEEHQMQSKIYVDIKSEYEVQTQNKINDVGTTKGTGQLATLFSAPGLSFNHQENRRLPNEDNGKKMG
ncbi:uncharacterized protein gce isoform X2 [Eurosta solidaginis]|uniref:uncharacterized protein gce isoform X2 n=1 Tax=Eurosta solidaginis TaxID=178769 RepID=UPI0035312FD7